MKDRFVEIDNKHNVFYNFIAHSMAHTLGAVYDTPHGVACAMMLPIVMDFNKECTGEKYKAIAEEDLAFLCESAKADACAPGNPKAADIADFEAMFRKLM